MDHPVFITTQELQELIDAKAVQILDSGMDHKYYYLENHIPEAIYFDICEIKSKTSTLSTDFPSLGEFGQFMIQRGIRCSGVRTVIYDQNGVVMSGRCWFMMRYFGVVDAMILNGGLVKWMAEGRPVEGGERMVLQDLGEDDFNFHETHYKRYRVLYPEVNKLSEEIEGGRTDTTLWDCRPTEVYEEGTIRTARNLPLWNFLNPDKTVKSKEQVFEIIKSRVASNNIIVSCMKGVVACFGFAMLTHSEYPTRRIYTGSYEEWCKMKSL
jgi:thiosulfate/3-mercaptopyruvate sulfurtransferase